MNKGYIMIMNVLFLAIITVIVIIGVTHPILSSYAAAKSFIESKKTFLLAHSATEEALYRLTTNKILGSSSSITLSSTTATISTVTTSVGKDVTVTTPSATYQRNIKLSLLQGTGISFFYGIQSGQGGFDLNNSSQIVGNVFSSGPITGAGNTITGDIVSSGPSGLIDNIRTPGKAFAHTISNSNIGQDAYYVVKTATTVGGTSYPNSPDQPVVDLPISDEQITEWESDAAAGGTATCSSGTYTISSDATIGPLKIPCNLVIRNSPTVTLAGPIWVTGNITTQNSPTIRVSSSLGSKSIPLIADNTSNRLTSSLIDIGNSTSFQGSGTTGSYVFLISQNNSAELGGSTNAITVGQSSSALVVYASHGLITLAQSVSLKEATAYKIILNNSASVTYETGLANTLFSSGPGGGYEVIEWREI